jgi:hypothetical protein
VKVRLDKTEKRGANQWGANTCLRKRVSFVGSLTTPSELVSYSVRQEDD